LIRAANIGWITDFEPYLLPTAGNVAFARLRFDRLTLR
jgi:hypothetical protein